MRRRAPEERRRQGRSWRAWAAGGALVCVAAGASAGGLAAAESGGATYRTATATTASVESVLTVLGTAQPVSRATLSFGASGTVQALDVSLGQQVSAGQTLATLVPTSLQEAVNAAQSQLSAAAATLASDEAAQSAATPSPSSSGATGVATSGTGGQSGVAAAQAALVSAQQAADADQQTAAADLASAQAACGGSGGTAPTARAGSTPPGSTPPGSTPPGSTPTGSTPTGSTNSACAAALAASLSAQEQVSSAQQSLASSEATLARLLASPSSATASPSASHGPSGSGGRNGTGSSGDVTAAKLATDQETVDRDQADLIEAEQSLAAATLTTPLSGTVVADSLAVGESVGDGSTSAVVTVVSSGSYEATATLTVSQAAEVKVGDVATVSVAGTTETLHGTVIRVGPVDVSAGNTYPVVVTLPDAPGSVFTGSSAEIGVVLGRAADVLAVPTTAVHSLGNADYVFTLSEGREHRTTVTVGIVGEVRTQIESGIRKGETIVLADMTSPVPTSNSTSPFGGINALRGSGGFTFVGPGKSFHVQFAPKGAP